MIPIILKICLCLTDACNKYKQSQKVRKTITNLKTSLLLVKLGKILFYFATE